MDNGKAFFNGWAKNMDWADVAISTGEGALAGATMGTSLLAESAFAAARSSIDWKGKDKNPTFIGGGLIDDKYNKDPKQFGIDLIGEFASIGLNRGLGLSKVEFQPNPKKIDWGGGILETGIKGSLYGIWDYGSDKGANYIFKNFPKSKTINLPEVEIKAGNRIDDEDAEKIFNNYKNGWR